MILEKPKREKSEAYLEYIRQQPCVIARFDSLCDGPIDAHHITERGQGKVGSKPSDRKTLPFCRYHHNLFHAIGSVEKFERRFPVILNYEMLRLEGRYRAPVKAKREKRIGIVAIDVRCRCIQKTHHFPPSKVIHTETGLYWQCPILRERVEVE